jgi:hypothetical protein
MAGGRKSLGKSAEGQRTRKPHTKAARLISPLCLRMIGVRSCRFGQAVLSEHRVGVRLSLTALPITTSNMNSGWLPVASSSAHGLALWRREALP